MKKFMLVTVIALMSVMLVDAQTVKVADKELIGAWQLEWMQYDGEKKILCGKGTEYTSFKYYGQDGEYACAEIALSKDGKCVILPHEYGKYTYKDGRYSEMGRPIVKPEEMQMIDKTHFRGRWKNRTEAWKKLPALPKNVVDYIVNCCKDQNIPDDINKAMKQQMF